jgi:hypothetical protein
VIKAQKELELTTLQERRHWSDMLKLFKILTGKDNVSNDHWATVRTRQAADLM